MSCLLQDGVLRNKFLIVALLEWIHLLFLCDKAEESD